jgi:hypothetical protein
MDGSGNYGITVIGCVSVLIAGGRLPVRDSGAGCRRPTPAFHMPAIGDIGATRRIRAAQTDLANPGPVTRFSLAAC